MTIEERILKQIENAFVLQNTFGRTVGDLPAIAKGIYQIVPESHRVLIPEAIEIHIRQSENFPTPADILKILGCVQSFDQTYYRRLLEKQKGGYIGWGEQEYIRAYEKNCQASIGMHPDIKAAHLQLEGRGPVLAIENSANPELVDSEHADPLFELFWDCCPKKTNKPETKKIFMAIVNGLHHEAEQTSAEEIIEGMQYFRSAMRDTEDQYIKPPSSWLNESGWLNEHKGTKRTKWGWWRGTCYFADWLCERFLERGESHLPTSGLRWDWITHGPPLGHPECILDKPYLLDPDKQQAYDAVLEMYKPYDQFEGQVQSLIDRFGLMEEHEKKAIERYSNEWEYHSSKQVKKENTLLPWQRYKEDDCNEAEEVM